jgi:adenine C2-methylase RlmN of 23S rRNA A2503 and tRNA A37
VLQKHCYDANMAPIAKALKNEEHVSDKKEYLQNELESLGIAEPYLLQNELNDKEEELQALAESIKSAYYQAYKTAYNSSSDDSSQGNNNKDG